MMGETESELDRIKRLAVRQEAFLCQTLGAALGYPRSPTHGEQVMVGEHGSEALALEAAKRIKELEARPNLDVGCRINITKALSALSVLAKNPGVTLAESTCKILQDAVAGLQEVMR